LPELAQGEWIYLNAEQVALAKFRSEE
ncbi:MAG: 16S rRNA pseudouridine(516) synthase, partial [Acinetobacter sp.]